MTIIILIIIATIILFIVCNSKTQIKKNEPFSIVYPYYNPYYPYTNPYSQCVEDVYGNIRCYAPSYYNKYYLPYRRRYPHRFKRVFRKYH